LLLALVAVQEGSSSQRPLARFLKAPVIYQNPNPAAPLAAIVEFITNEPVRAALVVNDGHSERVLPFWKSFQTEFILPVLGLRPGRKSTITVIVSDRLGREIRWPDLEFTTDPLPDDFPFIETTVSRPLQMEPGVTLFAPFKPGTPSYGLLLAVNENGEVVWYYRSDENMGDVRRLRNDNLLSLDVSGATEIDMLGNVVQHWHPTGLGKTGHGISTPVSVDSFHHEIYPLDSERFLVLSSELRHLSGYPASETDPDAPPADANVVGDVIAEFTRDGVVVGFWRLLDLLDPYRIGFGSLSGAAWDELYAYADGGTKDWAHSNAVIHDPTDDSLIVSLRHQDAVVKIRRKTGELVWILGTPEGWNTPWSRYLLSPDGELDWPYHQHAPEITPHGTILVFDNGNFRHSPFDGREDVNYSRAVEYSVDEERMSVSQLWTYGGPDSEMFFSNALGDADWMPLTGNVLITDGSRVTEGPTPSRWARILEVTHTTPAEKVFELIIRDAPGRSPSGWRVYRSERLSSLYPSRHEAIERQRHF